MNYHLNKMRIKFTLFLLLAHCGFYAQHFCYTTEASNKWFAQHPELKAAFEAQQEEAARQDKARYQNGHYTFEQAKSSAAASNYTIPVVFHILHQGGNENISDAQVIDAVNILTRDFNKLNADTTSVVASFTNNIGNPKFEFKLATKDPNGNCTNGIIRHWDVNTDWDKDFSRYVYTWPPTKYLNIYVIRSMADAAGYTFLPGSGIPTSADAIVILSTYVGSIGTGNGGTSRALTHEVGHWFNLQHTWGGTNQPGVACGDDGVSDTPISKGFTSCNLNNASICNPPIVENMQNYMDYAYCQRMFTQGQSVRMVNAINSSINSRNNLSASINLLATGVTSQGSGCAPMVDISALPSTTICSGKSLNLVSYTSNATPISYQWSAGSGATVNSPSTQTTSVLFANPGTVTVSCTVTGPGGSVTKSLTVLVKNGATDYSSSYSESFELSSLPNYWNYIGSPGAQWQLFNGAASHGAQSMYVAGETLPANSTLILQGPSFDFKNNPGSLFTFKYAYARQSSSNKDVFKVQVSKDCGGTWADIWAPGTAALAAPSGGVNTNPLYPFDEWVLYDLTAHPAFTPYKNESSLKIRFYFQEDPGGAGYGNRFFLDEINFGVPNGVNEITRSIGLNLYPNPSNGGFKLGFTLSEAGSVNYNLCSVDGSVVRQSHAVLMPSGSHEITLNSDDTLAPGVYFINFQLNGINMSRKLIIE